MGEIVENEVSKDVNIANVSNDNVEQSIDDEHIENTSIHSDEQNKSNAIQNIADEDDSMQQTIVNGQNEPIDSKDNDSITSSQEHVQPQNTDSNVDDEQQTDLIADDLNGEVVENVNNKIIESKCNETEANNQEIEERNTVNIETNDSETHENVKEKQMDSEEITLSSHRKTEKLDDQIPSNNDIEDDDEVQTEDNEDSKQNDEEVHDDNDIKKNENEIDQNIET